MSKDETWTDRDLRPALLSPRPVSLALAGLALLLGACAGDAPDPGEPPGQPLTRDGGAGIALPDGPPLDVASPATEGLPAADDGGGGGGAGGGDASTACVDPAALPPMASPDPPTEATTCTYMDWRLSPDGFYLISQFGMDLDDTTWGRGTSCSGLISHYATWCCQYDRHQDACIDGQQPRFLECKRDDPAVPKPPWVKGTVDYTSATVYSRIDAHYFNASGDLAPYDPTQPFDWPEYFYVAGAQRFDCGSLLRVTNTENGRCIVAYVEDGGPGATYERAEYGGRRIVDASPALHRYLEPQHAGWRTSTLLYVEWGLPGDHPGMPCTPCQSTPAKRGTEAQRTGFDLNHFDAPNCRATVGP